MAAAAAALAAALPPRVQRMSGQKWVHCLVFGQLVCCEPPPPLLPQEIESQINYAFVIHKQQISFRTGNLCITNTYHLCCVCDSQTQKEFWDRTRLHIVATEVQDLQGVGLPIASGTDCLTIVQRASDPLLMDHSRDFNALPFLKSLAVVLSLTLTFPSILIFKWCSTTNRLSYHTSCSNRPCYTYGGAQFEPLLSPFALQLSISLVLLQRFSENAHILTSSLEIEYCLVVSRLEMYRTYVLLVRLTKVRR